MFVVAAAVLWAPACAHDDLVLDPYGGAAGGASSTGGASGAATGGALATGGRTTGGFPATGGRNEMDGSPGMTCWPTKCTTRPFFHCDARNGQCVQCLIDQHCPQPPQSPVDMACDSQFQVCVPSCRSDRECGFAPGFARCNLDSHRCVECLDDFDCGGQRGYCNQATKQCVECLNDSHCEPQHCDSTGRCGH